MASKPESSASEEAGGGVVVAAFLFEVREGLGVREGPVERVALT